MHDTPYGYCHCGCGQETKPARHSNAKLGWVKGEPLRFVHGHGRWAKAKTLDEQYVVDPDTNCWLWTGRLSKGYGQTWQNGHNVIAHRAFWIRAHGQPPEGHVIHHKCGNRRCVNVEHLEAAARGNHQKFHQTRLVAIDQLTRERDFWKARSVTDHHAMRDAFKLLETEAEVTKDRQFAEAARAILRGRMPR